MLKTYLVEFLSRQSEGVQIALFGFLVLFLVVGFLFVLRLFAEALLPEPRYIKFPTNPNEVNPFMERFKEQRLSEAQHTKSHLNGANHE